MHLFAYGTLMFPEVWQAIVGRSFPNLPGHLSGYQVFRVRDAVYPGIIAGTVSAFWRKKGLSPSSTNNVAERLARFVDIYVRA